MYLNTTPHTLSRGEPLTSQLVEDSGDGFGTSLTGHVHGELVLLQETEIMSQAMQGPTHRLRGLSGADREQRGRTIPLEACLARSRQQMAGGGGGHRIFVSQAVPTETISMMSSAKSGAG